MVAGERVVEVSRKEVVQVDEGTGEKIGSRIEASPG